MGGNLRVSCKGLQASGVAVVNCPACVEAQEEMRDCKKRCFVPDEG